MSLKILIIDDDPGFRHMVQIKLKSWQDDLSIDIAESLAEASSKLDNETYDLVIKDQHLPDGLGYDFRHTALTDSTVLAVSSDETPELPGVAVMSGAEHFLGKRQVSEPLFIPLVAALVERKKLQNQILATRLKQSKMDTVSRLLTTLKHEINNPLGAVLGGAYLVKTAGNVDEEQKKALSLIEESGNRIKHVIKELSDAMDLEEVQKASEEVFLVPGDAKWEEKDK